MPIVRDKYRITQNDENVTLADGTANQESTIATFVVPDRTAFEINPDDIFSIYLANNAGTEAANTAQIKVTHEDPNGISVRQLALVDYIVVKEFADRLKIYTFGQSATLKPKDRIRIKVTADVAVDKSRTRFQISATRVAESLRM